MEQALNRLETLCQKLNDASDSLISAISAMEQKIRSQRPGVSVWLGADLIGLEEVRSNSGEVCHSGFEIGWTRLKKEWRIAARRVVRTEPGGRTTRSEPMPLIGAPRKVRIEALGQFELLVSKISEKLEELLKKMKEVPEGE